MVKILFVNFKLREHRLLIVRSRVTLRVVVPLVPKNIFGHLILNSCWNIPLCLLRLLLLKMIIVLVKPTAHEDLRQIQLVL